MRFKNGGLTRGYVALTHAKTQKTWDMKASYCRVSVRSYSVKASIGAGAPQKIG